MDKTSKMRFIEVKGSAYERGKQSGKMFQKVMKEAESRYGLLYRDAVKAERARRIESRVKEIFPEYLEEVYGRADGAGIDPKLYFFMMCPELLGEGTGCTSIVYKRQDGTIVLAHNEDDVFTVDNSCITKCITDNGWFVTSDYYIMPFGNGFSWNSHGIVKTVNYCASLQDNLDGIPRYFAQRHISEAVSLEDFVQRCNMPDRASGFHAIAVDMNNNRAISVEVTADDVSVMEITDPYAHTNHYIHDRISDGKVHTAEGSTSPFRLAKAKEMLDALIDEKAEAITSADMVRILQYRGSGFKDSVLAVQGDPYGTFATFSVDTKRKNKVFLEVYISREAFSLDYDADLHPDICK